MSNYESKFSSQSMTIISWLMVGTLLISTLPRGGNFPWFTLVLSLIMAVSLSIYIFSQRHLEPSYEKVWLTVWLTFSALITIQLFLTPRLVEWNSPNQSIINVSSYPVNTVAILDSWVRFSCYWLIAFFVSQFNRQAIKYCLITIFVVLAFQIIYGVVANSIGQTTIIGIWPKEHYTTSATGSFVNHNHYANYIAVAAPIVIGYTLTSNYLINKKYLNYLVAAILFFACIIALVASLSRGGSASGIFGLVLLFSVYLLKYRSINRKTFFIISLIGCFLLLCFLSFIEVGDIIDRFKRVLIYDMRWEIWEATFELPSSLWILGSGGGTFPDVFWKVHPPTTPKTAYYAHNDYIQFLIEYGIIGAIVMSLAVFYWYKKTQVKKLAFVQIASLVSLLVMGLHSIVDFSLHIPANAILFWFCVGLLFNNNLNKTKRKRVTSFSTKTT